MMMVIYFVYGLASQIGCASDIFHLNIMEILHEPNLHMTVDEEEKNFIQNLDFSAFEFNDEDDNFNSKFLLIFTPFEQVNIKNLLNTEYEWENNVFAIDALGENKVIAKFKDKSNAINFLSNYSSEFKYEPPIQKEIEDDNPENQDISTFIPRLFNPKDEKLLLSTKWYKLFEEQLDSLYLCRFAKNIEIRLANFNKRLDLRHIICTKSKSVSKVNGGEIGGRTLIPYNEMGMGIEWVAGSNLADLESRIYKEKGVKERASDSSLNAEEISYEDQMNVAYKSVVARRRNNHSHRYVQSSAKSIKEESYMMADLEEGRPKAPIPNSGTSLNRGRHNNFGYTAQTLDQELEDYHSEFNKDEPSHRQLDEDQLTPNEPVDGVGGTDLDVIKRNLRMARKRKNREHLIDMNPGDRAYNLTRSATPPRQLESFYVEEWDPKRPQSSRDQRSRSPLERVDKDFDLRQKLGRKRI